MYKLSHEKNNKSDFMRLDLFRCYASEILDPILYRFDKAIYARIMR